MKSLENDFCWRVLRETCLRFAGGFGWRLFRKIFAGEFCFVEKICRRFSEEPLVKTFTVGFCRRFAEAFGDLQENFAGNMWRFCRRRL